MIVRHARPSDEVAIRRVHRLAFDRGDGSPAVEAVLWDRLVEVGADVPVLSFVAQAGDRVVGHIGVSGADIDGRPVPAIGPVGVLPEHQGQGIGSALLHAVIGAAEATGRRVLVLLGDPGFYERFGFRPGADLAVAAPLAAWGSHFQVLPLSAYDATLVGRFRYAAPFRELDPAFVGQA